MLQLNIAKKSEKKKVEQAGYVQGKRRKGDKQRGGGGNLRKERERKIGTGA
jgi:hypothetical protein